MAESAFNPTQYIIQIQGREYIEVKYRVMWFRSEHPRGAIETEVIHLDEAAAAIKATVRDGEGKILATGMALATPGQSKLGRYLEKAETAAVGRALGLAGYGTQFAGEELDEGDHLADASVESRQHRPVPIPTPKQSSHPQRPWEPDYLWDYTQAKIKDLSKVVAGPASGPQVQKLAICFSEAAIDAAIEDAVLNYLMGAKSKKALSKAQANCLIDWLTKDVEMAANEARAIYTLVAEVDAA